jgi:hypothetical protein
MLRKIEICRQCKNKKYAGSAEICRWCRTLPTSDQEVIHLLFNIEIFDATNA